MPGNAGGAKGAGHLGSVGGQPAPVVASRSQVSEPTPKPFTRDFQVGGVGGLSEGEGEPGQGAAGVDEQSMAEFEVDPKGNLYKLWNRLSSGSL